MADSPCAGCGKPMGYGDYEEACGKEYHVECFVCCFCKKPFEGGRFFEEDSQPCHEECIPKGPAKEKAAPKSCAECGNVIGPGTEAFKVKYKDEDEAKMYHLKCIKCADCGKPIGEAKHAISHGRPVHTGCMHGAQRADGAADVSEFAEDLKCSHCGEVIRGRKKEVPEFGSFHLTCFKCCKCGLGITGDTFYKDPGTGKARCHRCPP